MRRSWCVALIVVLVLAAASAQQQQQQAKLAGQPATQQAADAATSAPATSTRLPKSLWAFKPRPGKDTPSYSVIIPSHNTAPYITTALQSVADSVKYFNERGGLQFQGEVVVVDDASTDNTVARIIAFMEQQKALNITNLTWKIVSMQQNVLGGAARNFGVRESSGDIVFFLDSDDVYRERHIAICMTSLFRNAELAMVQTKAVVEIDNIHPRWKEKVEGTIPHTRALWRKVHDFVEGFPEQGVFTRHQDVGYLLAFAAANAPMAVLNEETVVYKRYPGNSLDQQAAKFASDPKNAPKSPEEMTEEFPVRMSIMELHNEHVKRNLARVLKGEAPLADPLWAIYQYAADQVLPQRYETLLDLKKIRFRSLLDVAEKLTFAGKEEEAKSAFSVIHKFVYNTTAEAARTVEPFHFILSTRA